MDALIHITLNTGEARISPRSEVTADTVAMLKPIVAAGAGEIGNLHIAMEAAFVFTLGWQADAPAVPLLLGQSTECCALERSGRAGE